MVGSSKRGALFAAFVAGFAVAPTAVAAEPTAAGVWKQIDPDSKKVGGYIQILEGKGHAWEGYIVKMFPKPGDPENPVCSACTDDRKDKPVLGIRLMQNLKRDGLTYEGGTIINPIDGNEYNVKMSLSEDGQTLTVRGYLGLSLLGQSQEWERLPADETAKLDTDKDAKLHKVGGKKKKAKGHAPAAAAAAPSEAAPPAEKPAEAPPPAEEKK